MTESVEQWSGKDRGDENFPVGSMLIRRSLRPACARLLRLRPQRRRYRRQPRCSPPQDKIDRLDIGCRTCCWGTRDHRRARVPRGCAQALRTTGVRPRPRHRSADRLSPGCGEDPLCRHRPSCYEYCRNSAMPVGRYLLDLHGEPADTHAGSDALCSRAADPQPPAGLRRRPRRPWTAATCRRI